MKRLLACVMLFSALTACAPNSATLSGSVTHSERGVTVDIVVVVDDNGAGVARATFTPDNEAWHLYDTAMARDGVEGFGRPTRLEIVEGARASGPTTANQDPYDLPIDSLGLEVPVYPDGPVTLTKTFTSTDGFVDVSLTYMSCGSDGGCTVPVMDRIVQITLTQAN